MSRPVRVVLVTAKQARRERRSRLVINLVLAAAGLWALWLIAGVISAALPAG